MLLIRDKRQNITAVLQQGMEEGEYKKEEHFKSTLDLI